MFHDRQFSSPIVRTHEKRWLYREAVGTSSHSVRVSIDWEIR
jgi:hypothetical protein